MMGVELEMGEMQSLNCSEDSTGCYSQYSADGVLFYDAVIASHPSELNEVKHLKAEIESAVKFKSSLNGSKSPKIVLLGELLERPGTTWPTQLENSIKNSSYMMAYYTSAFKEDSRCERYVCAFLDACDHHEGKKDYFIPIVPSDKFNLPLSIAGAQPVIYDPSKGLSRSEAKKLKTIFGKARRKLSQTQETPLVSTDASPRPLRSRDPISDVSPRTTTSRPESGIGTLESKETGINKSDRSTAINRPYTVVHVNNKTTHILNNSAHANADNHVNSQPNDTAESGHFSISTAPVSLDRNLPLSIVQSSRVASCDIPVPVDVYNDSDYETGKSRLVLSTNSEQFSGGDNSAPANSVHTSSFPLNTNEPVTPYGPVLSQPIPPPVPDDCSPQPLTTTLRPWRCCLCDNLLGTNDYCEARTKDSAEKLFVHLTCYNSPQ